MAEKRSKLPNMEADFHVRLRTLLIVCGLIHCYEVLVDLDIAFQLIKKKAIYNANQIAYLILWNIFEDCIVCSHHRMRDLTFTSPEVGSHFKLMLPLYHTAKKLTTRYEIIKDD
jgi:hypothetical protein